MLLLVELWMRAYRRHPFLPCLIVLPFRAIVVLKYPFTCDFGEGDSGVVLEVVEYLWESISGGRCAVGDGSHACMICVWPGHNMEFKSLAGMAPVWYCE